MRGAMFFVAGLVAGLAIQAVMAQSSNSGVVMMNHVGINVPSIPEAIAWYEQKMGYREAFRLSDPKGQPRLVYMQISKNTFLELQQATAERPAGFTHYGLQVDNAAQVVIARFRKNGLTVTDTTVSDTKAILANITDPYMGRIELTELPPESLHYKSYSELEVNGRTRRSIGMSVSRVARFGFTGWMIVICTALLGTSVQAQQRGGTVQTDKVAPVNSGDDPYVVIRDWAHLEYGEKAVGWFSERRGHRQRRQICVGDRTDARGGGTARVPRHESEPGPPF